MAPSEVSSEPTHEDEDEDDWANTYQTDYTSSAMGKQTLMADVSFAHSATPILYIRYVCMYVCMYVYLHLKLKLRRTFHMKLA
jgi:hypothetical protein